ncbi:hypothetical protein PoB_005845100 [Plakobranchus ocellatus]|uniref:Uncharacterized protein n=1 Tax=Plakobranchus ocellatus TaxID=259542 RepID=A0AAV4C9F0_9GAST|nr:hypothetical protein PoB_005845100 [Plakobranchus ocellatus]
MTFNLLSQLIDRSTNKEDEDEGSPVDDVGVETDDESDVNFDVVEGEVDGLRLDSSDDDESEYQVDIVSPNQRHYRLAQDPDREKLQKSIGL